MSPIFKSHLPLSTLTLALTSAVLHGVSAAQTPLLPLPIVNGAGAPAPWQGARRLHPDFQVNLATGNVYFQFVTSGYRFAGLEPNPSLTLCFNRLAAGKAGDFTAGFGLGSGWSTSLGGRLEFPSPDAALLTRADGTEILFVRDGAEWDAMDGYFLELEADASGWTVRDSRQWEFDFDSGGRRTRIVSATGNAHAISYQGTQASGVVDPSSRGANFAYGASGKLDTMTDSFGNTWSFTYDASGRLAGIDDSEHGSVTLTYDAQGRIDSVSDLDDHLWQIAYVASGPWEGRVQTITDPLSHSETYDYEAGAANDCTLVTDTRGNTWRYFHDREDSPALVRFKNPLGKIWTQVYSDQRRRTSWRDPLGHSGSATYDGQGGMLTRLDSLGHGSEYTYDALGNITSVTTAGRVTEYFYEDALHPTLLTRIEEPEDEDLGVRPTTTISYYGPADGPVPGRWNGLLAALTDAEGVLTRYTYDSYGLLATIAEGPAGASGGVEVRYDQGTSPVHVDLGGMSYPAHFPALPPLPTQIAGRLEQQVVDPFDTNWRGLVRGKEIWVDAPIDSGSGWESSMLETAWDYDHRGRIVGQDVETDEIHGHVGSPPATVPVRSFSTVFDDDAPDGRVVSKTPDGDTLTTLRDEAGRVASYAVDDGFGGQLSAVAEYYDDGRLETLTRSDGTSSQFTYEDNGLLDTVTHLFGQTPLLALDYSYDARNLPTGVVETTRIRTVTKTFEHDDLSRLVGEGRAVSPAGTLEGRSYTYDLVGNRIGPEIHIDGALLESATYHYDLEAALIYESENNRLMWVETFDGAGTPVATTWLFYDNPFGHVSRIVERVAGSSTYSATAFVYDEEGRPWLLWGETWTDTGSGPMGHVREVMLETRQDSWRQRRWRKRDPQTLAPLPGEEWVTRFGGLGASFSVDGQDGALSGLQLDLDGLGRFAAIGGETYAYDALGTVRLRKADAGIGTQEATAFGEVLDADPGAELGFAGAFGVRQGLDGAALSGSGVVLMGYRHYAPSFGRFLMRDPLGVHGGLDVYVFAKNAPTAYVDPVGLSPHGGVYPRPPAIGPPTPPDRPLYTPWWLNAGDPGGILPLPGGGEPQGPLPPWPPPPSGEDRPRYTGPKDTPPPGPNPGPGELPPGYGPSYPRPIVEA